VFWIALVISFPMQFESLRTMQYRGSYSLYKFTNIRVQPALLMSNPLPAVTLWQSNPSGPGDPKPPRPPSPPPSTAIACGHPARRLPRQGTPWIGRYAPGGPLCHKTQMLGAAMCRAHGNLLMCRARAATAPHSVLVLALVSRAVVQAQ
jgi:hypothetical protein